MQTDPNWLLSTVVQSTAAFVAIIAGFIISRLLALAAERDGLEARIRDIEVLLKINEQSLIPLQKRILDWDARNFLGSRDVFKKIIESEGQISLTDVMDGNTAYKRRIDELQPYWDAEIETTKKAFQLIKDHFSEVDDAIEPIDERIKNLWPSLSQHEVQIFIDAYARLRSKGRNNNIPWGGMTGTLVGVGMHEFYAVEELNRYRDLETEIETLEREKNALETQSSHLKDRRKHLIVPKGLSQSINILIYIAITGIAFPAVLLPFSPDQFTPFFKWIILVPFISDLVVFFVFFSRLIRQLK
jgi:predicted  nucleic acid-binding Zn-ribbon protein